MQQQQQREVWLPAARLVGELMATDAVGGGTVLNKVFI